MGRIEKIKHRQIRDKQNAKVYALLEKIIKNVAVRPILIGISGHAHVGKKTLAKNFSKTLGPRKTIILDTADYNFSRYYRTPRGLTGANPLGIQLKRIKTDISKLIRGRQILKPKYNHKTGKILKPKLIKARPIILIIGLASLHKQLGIKYNITYFIDGSKHRNWNFVQRIKRATEKRGYEKNEAIYYEKIQDSDYKKFILPCKKDADLVYSVDKNYKLTLTRISPRIKKLLNG
jgi:phosphoribulokinase